MRKEICVLCNCTPLKVQNYAGGMHACCQVRSEWLASALAVHHEIQWQAIVVQRKELLARHCGRSLCLYALSLEEHPGRSLFAGCLQEIIERANTHDRFTGAPETRIFILLDELKFFSSSSTTTYVPINQNLREDDGLIETNPRSY